jgi:hypothetical protein
MLNWSNRKTLMSALNWSVHLLLVGAGAPDEDAAKKDLEALQGSWIAVVVEQNGENVPDDD